MMNEVVAPDKITAAFFPFRKPLLQRKSLKSPKNHLRAERSEPPGGYYSSGGGDPSLHSSVRNGR